MHFKILAPEIQLARTLAVAQPGGFLGEERSPERGQSSQFLKTGLSSPRKLPPVTASPPNTADKLCPTVIKKVQTSSGNILSTSLYTDGFQSTSMVQRLIQVLIPFDSYSGTLHVT